MCLESDSFENLPRQKAKELNYEEMDSEHRRLLQLIREAASDVREEPVDVVHMRPQVLGPLVARNAYDMLFVSIEGTRFLTIRSASSRRRVRDQ